MSRFETAGRLISWAGLHPLHCKNNSDGVGTEDDLRNLIPTYGANY